MLLVGAPVASATKTCYVIGTEQRAKEGAIPLVARPYAGTKKSWQSIGERQELILKLAGETQLLILQDKDFHSLKTPDGVGPVHDIAQWGTPKAQLYLWHSRAIFDTKEFHSEACGTPIDVLASCGCREVQKEIKRTPLELLKERAGMSPLIYKLARRVRSEDYLHLLGLPPDILRAKTAEKQSVLSAMYHPASREMQKEIARKFRGTPLWNRQTDQPN